MQCNFWSNKYWIRPSDIVRVVDYIKTSIFGLLPLNNKTTSWENVFSASGSCWRAPTRICTSSRRIGKRSCGRAHVTRARCILDGTCCFVSRVSLRCLSFSPSVIRTAIYRLLTHIHICPHMQCDNNKIWRCCQMVNADCKSWLIFPHAYIILPKLIKIFFLYLISRDNIVVTVVSLLSGMYYIINVPLRIN